MTNILNVDDKEKLQKNNTHPDYYGKFAIAFQKNGAKKNLQPVQYINADSEYAKEFKKTFIFLLEQTEISDLIYYDILNRLAYFKPLHGEMVRYWDDNTKQVRINKNFHDEKEWRYVPTTENLRQTEKEKIIIKPSIKEYKDVINKELENASYDYLWLKFDYDDIRHLIVPDIASRIELINHIMNLSDEKFKINIQIDVQKYILISKILVLEEIRKDW